MTSLHEASGCPRLLPASSSGNLLALGGGRGGSGIINCKVTDRNGSVASVCAVRSEDHVMVVTNRGMMIRVEVAQISPTQDTYIYHDTRQPFPTGGSGRIHDNP